MTTPITEHRCGSCQHWAEPGSWEPDAIIRRCLAIRESWVVEGEALRAASPEECEYGGGLNWDHAEKVRNDAFIKAKAVAQDGSSYSAHIRTTKEFGCVLWQAKN